MRTACIYTGFLNSGKSLIALSISLTIKKFIDIGNSASIFKFQSAVNQRCVLFEEVVFEPQTLELWKKDFRRYTNLCSSEI